MSAGRVIDATGLVVAPGFIDVQGQSGTTALADGNMESHLRQGITSEIIGEGSSPAFWTADTANAESLAPFGLAFDWTGLTGYFSKLRERGIALNLGTFVPATMVRRAVVGLDNRAPTPDELRRILSLMIGDLNASHLGITGGGGGGGPLVGRLGQRFDRRAFESQGRVNGAAGPDRQ